MNWESVRNDPYYRGREIEAGARRAGSVEAWQEYASLKANKGSYALAAHGFLSAALLCEKKANLAKAFDLLGKAFQSSCRAGSKDLAMIIAYHHASLAEQAGKWDICIEVYENLGKFCEELGSYFLAADAYEHVAEILATAGREVRDYVKPIELWKRNADYWREKGHEDDARWSERHAELYQSLTKGSPA